MFWIGDHPPRHVHIFRDRKMIAKVELDDDLTLMEGKMTRKLFEVIQVLQKEGKLK